MSIIFVTGIGTDVGKTVASAIVVESLKSDYFKPVQAGDLHFTDTDKVKSLISNSVSKFHKSSYELKTPMSPHAAAEIDNTVIETSNIKIPETENHLVVEGAGGILVPINDHQTILDLIQPSHKVIVVSRHYLGSINHSLLTLSTLKRKGFEVGLIFNGSPTKTTEDIITKMTGVTVIGRIDEEPQIDKQVISQYAIKFNEKLKKFIQ